MLLPSRRPRLYVFTRAPGPRGAVAGPLQGRDLTLAAGLRYFFSLAVMPLLAPSGPPDGRGRIASVASIGRAPHS